MRINFCGVIEGSVTVRDGESESDAIQRAEDKLCEILSRYARRYVRRYGASVVGLGPAPDYGLRDDGRPYGSAPAAAPTIATRSG